VEVVLEDMSEKLLPVRLQLIPIPLVLVVVLARQEQMLAALVLPE
jgi:hypothetical protein